MGDDRDPIDLEGNVYEKGFLGDYHRKEGLFGPEKDEGLFGPNVKEGLFGPERAKGRFGGELSGGDGTPLYQSSGGGGSGDAALGGLIAIVVIVAIVVAIVVILAIVAAIVAVIALIAWWARGLFRSIRRDIAAGEGVSGKTLAWAGSGVAAVALVAVGIAANPELFRAAPGQPGLGPDTGPSAGQTEPGPSTPFPPSLSVVEDAIRSNIARAGWGFGSFVRLAFFRAEDDSSLFVCAELTYSYPPGTTLRTRNLYYHMAPRSGGSWADIYLSNILDADSFDQCVSEQNAYHAELDLGFVSLAAPVRPTSAAGSSPDVQPPGEGGFVPRWGAASVGLANGSILVVGGTNQTNSDGAVRAAQLYEPASGRWRDAAAMRERRAYPTAALLPDGRVLVAGGSRDGAPLATCEIYDPEEDTWTRAPKMMTARSFFDLVPLADGRLLAAGGGTTGARHPATAKAEIYDPRTSTWTATGSMDRRRAFAATVSLSDGRVIVIGGSPIYFGKIVPTRSTEIWDPSTESWADGPLMSTPRFYAEAVALGDAVVVAGGWPDDGATTPALATTELLRTSVDGWSPTGPMGTGRAQFTMLAIDDQRALVLGGVTGPSNTVVRSTEIFDVATLSWQDGPNLPAAAWWPAASRMIDGNVLVAGGAMVADGSAATDAHAVLPIAP